jgi:hypothetical protein
MSDRLISSVWTYTDATPGLSASGLMMNVVFVATALSCLAANRSAIDVPPRAFHAS